LLRETTISFSDATEVIYAHPRSLTSVFTNLLKMPLKVGLQAKCVCLTGTRGRWVHFRWQICDRK